MRKLRLVALAIVAGLVVTSAQEPQETQKPPRFRGGANLVRLDAYVTADGRPVTDLRAEDFEVSEDGVPQRVEQFELIEPRLPAPQSARVEPSTVAESRAMATDADSRVFVLFLDVWHVQIEGSYHAQNPITKLLDEVIGQDDMVGVMTPDMAARNLTLARRTATIEGILRNNWFWGERGRTNTSDPREREIEMCYPEQSRETAGIARELIERRREKKTLDAMADLIEHLEDLREERKFVVMLSEGWTLYGRNEQLARPLATSPGGTPRAPGGPEPIFVGPDGKLTRTDPDTGGSYDSCERERSMLAFSDHEVEFNQLLQRANRANISFYPVDPRGLVVFDDPIGPARPASPGMDRERLGKRQNALRTLAEQTDGVAVLNTNNLDVPMARMVSDTGAYYLLGYYSTNTRLDGRFRRISVKVRRPDVEVRGRPGYLAPTEAEMASARVDALMNGAPPGHSTMPAGLAVALESLAPTRGNVPLRAQASGGPGFIWFTAEVDAATMRQPEWQAGIRARVTFEHERGNVSPYVSDVELDPGQRMLSLVRPEGTILPPGRYVIRVEMSPTSLNSPIRTTVDVVVPEETALLGSSARASRRGPTTGLSYVPTADARFRRTERLRLEIPQLNGGTLSAKLMNREGQVLPLPVTLAERLDGSLQLRFIVADLTLAPLAQGEYVVQVSAENDGRSESVAYGFRVVP